MPVVTLMLLVMRMPANANTSAGAITGDGIYTCVCDSAKVKEGHQLERPPGLTGQAGLVPLDIVIETAMRGRAGSQGGMVLAERVCPGRTARQYQ